MQAFWWPDASERQRPIKVTRAKTSGIDKSGMIAQLRHAGVYGRYVVRAGGRGVILEVETRLEATGKDLVRN